jgi:hypothetical protein
MFSFVANVFAPCRPKINKLLVLEYVIAYGWFFNTHKIHKRKNRRNFGFEAMSPPFLLHPGPLPKSSITLLFFGEKIQQNFKSYYK